MRNVLASSLEFKASPRLVIIESDDWGNPTWWNHEHLASFEKAFPHIRKDPWYLDARETPEDLEMICNVLREHRDAFGQHPVLSLNWIVAGPDWDFIYKSGFKAYARVLHKRSDVTNYVAQCEQFSCELHGVEHFNPELMMQGLAQGDPVLHWFASERCVPPSSLVKQYPGLGAALLTSKEQEPSGDCIEMRIREGLQTCQALFAQKPLGVAPPNHCWDLSVEKAVNKHGLRVVRAAHYQYDSMSKFNRGEYAEHRTASKGSEGSILYAGRNLTFEPAVPGFSLEECINRAHSLLCRSVPVIINSHRLNYVGGISPAIRRKSLTFLGELLRGVTSAFPDVCFASARDFAEVMSSKNYVTKGGVKVRGGRGLLPQLRSWLTSR